MRDPHVVALRYHLKPTEGITFNNPEPLEWETDLFHMRLEEGRVVCTMKQHFSTSDEAQEAVEDYLWAWEVDAAIKFGRDVLNFVFEDAEIIDRDPPPPPPPGSPVPITIPVSVARLVLRTKPVTVRTTEPHYPDPPKHFRFSPDAKTIWDRYQGYQNDKEPLLSMAYFCLTVLESAVGSRKQAVEEYQIHEDVLHKLGELTSKRGDEKTARKYERSGLVPLSGVESAWVKAAVKVIIRRVGEHDSSTPPPPLSLITMKDISPKL